MNIRRERISDCGKLGGYTFFATCPRENPAGFLDQQDMASLMLGQFPGLLATFTSHLLGSHPPKSGSAKSAGEESDSSDDKTTYRAHEYLERTGNSADPSFQRLL